MPRSSSQTLPQQLAALALAALVAAAPASGTFAPSLVEHEEAAPVRAFNGSTLSSVAAPGYSSPFLVADIRGATYYDWGYAYGRLLANESLSNVAALYHHTVGSNPFWQGVLGVFLDYQFSHYLSEQLPQQYADELRGIEDAGRDLGLGTKLGAAVRQALALGNIATGRVLKDVEYLLAHEFHLGPKEAAGMAKLFERMTAGLFGRHCSMWGAWGQRTAGGGLWSGRNLDWQAQTGVANHKVLAVYHPPTSVSPRGSPYVVVGFAGLVGALTGMSGSGVTVHEAGNDNTRETLSGFAWMLRLRDLMEHATSLDDARERWAAANNTLGLNHGVGFGGPQARSERFMVMETCAGYTAYFYDQDAREAASPWGRTLSEAVYRTNHGFDPTFLKTAMYPANQTGTDSETRYVLLHDTLDQYTGAAMTPLQAVNCTAIDGDKGPFNGTAASFLDCSREHRMKGSNVLSVTFDANPQAPVMYVAIEDGAGESYVPASCGNYVRFNMSRWFS